MRATFTTEFIYDGVEGNYDRYVKMCEVLDVKHRKQDAFHMIGQISGILSGLDLGGSDIWRWFQEMCYDLARITKVPFKIVVLFEGGDTLIREIQPVSG